MLKEDSQAIEVEVVEIDGMTPPIPSAPSKDERTGRGAPWSNWQNWSGRVKQLDSRWWPLWVVLGIVVLGLILTLGVFFAIIYVIARFIRNVILGINSLFSPIKSSSLR